MRGARKMLRLMMVLPCCAWGVLGGYGGDPGGANGPWEKASTYLSQFRFI